MVHQLVFSCDELLQPILRTCILLTRLFPETLQNNDTNYLHNQLHLIKTSYQEIIIYVVVTWAGVVCLIYTHKARGLQDRGLRVYISGKP